MTKKKKNLSRQRKASKREWQINTHAHTYTQTYIQRYTCMVECMLQRHELWNNSDYSVKRENRGFPGVQWPRLHAHNPGGLSSIPGQGTSCHMPQPKILHATTKRSCMLQQRPGISKYINKINIVKRGKIKKPSLKFSPGTMKL